MTMRCLTIELVPEEAAVFSRTAATEGAHATLAGPPGAALLGWAASRCYEDLGDAAHTVFHSGMVRFSDAVRWVDGKPRFPNPAILLEPKHGDGETVLGRSRFEEVNNAGKDANQIQAEAVKGEWLSLDGEKSKAPETRRRMRTAMEDGTAKEGQLFGYQAIDPTGLCYRATIETDAGTDVLSENAWQLLVEAFSGGTVRLGRARASGYGGHYHCRIESAESFWPDESEVAVGKLVRFWLLSDAMLLNEWGAPKVAVKPSDFGLDDDDWQLAGGETAMSMRRAWPWNTTIKSRDLELALIEAGSVFGFEWMGGGEPPPVEPSVLIGTGHERGLGRVVVMPPDFNFRPGTALPVPPPAQKPAESMIAEWASRRADNLDDGRQLDWEDGRIAEVKRLIDRAGPSGPGTSQWSGIGAFIDPWVAEAAIKLDDELRDDSWNANLVGLDRWVRDTLFKLPEGESRTTMRPYIKRVIKAARAHAQGVRG